MSANTDFEHGVIVDRGDARMNGTLLRPTGVGCAVPGQTTLTLTKESHEERTHGAAGRAALSGGDRHVVGPLRRVQGYHGDRITVPTVLTATMTARKNPVLYAR